MFTVQSTSRATANGRVTRQMTHRMPAQRVQRAHVGAKRGDSVVRAGLFGLGLPEIVVIGGVAAVLFGPSKLPELGKSLGKTVKSFQEAATEFQEELKSEAGSDAEQKVIEDKEEDK